MATKKRPADDQEKQLELPLLWPDRAGSIRLPSPRAWRRHLPRRRSVITWLLARATGAIGFGTAREFAFTTWLERALDAADFGALEISTIVDQAQRGLELDLETVVRYLAKHTQERARFRSDGYIVTMRR